MVYAAGTLSRGVQVGVTVGRAGGGRGIWWEIGSVVARGGGGGEGPRWCLGCGPSLHVGGSASLACPGLLSSQFFLHRNRCYFLDPPTLFLVFFWLVCAVPFLAGTVLGYCTYWGGVTLASFSSPVRLGPSTHGLTAVGESCPVC